MPLLIYEINTLLQTNLDSMILDLERKGENRALDEYGQHMEDYLDVLEDMTQMLGKEVKRLRRKQRQFESLTTEAERSAGQFSLEGREQLARAAANRKRVMEQATDAYQQEADRQNARLLALMDVKLRLEARLTELAQKSAMVQAQGGRKIESLSPVLTP